MIFILERFVCENVRVLLFMEKISECQKMNSMFLKTIILPSLIKLLLI